jgi:hypothetical protein
MKRFFLAGALVFAAMLGLSQWLANDGLQVSDDRDRNVPGATTGPGKNTLISR